MTLVYNKSGDTIEIVIRDTNMRKLETWKFNVADKKLGNDTFNYLKRKYGFEPSIKPNESIGELAKKKPTDLFDMDVPW